MGTACVPPRQPVYSEAELFDVIENDFTVYKSEDVHTVLCGAFNSPIAETNDILQWGEYMCRENNVKNRCKLCCRFRRRNQIENQKEKKQIQF